MKDDLLPILDELQKKWLEFQLVRHKLDAFLINLNNPSKQFTIHDMTEFAQFCLNNEEDLSVGFLLQEYLNMRNFKTATNHENKIT